MTKYEEDTYLFDSGTKLGCPHLRYNADCWIALKKDPCPTCDSTCHNSGIPFKETDRFWIVGVKKESEE